jgi:hypothetical protein
MLQQMKMIRLAKTVTISAVCFATCCLLFFIFVVAKIG